MDKHAPLTQNVTASEARAQWSQLITKVARRQARVIVERSGIPVAAIISADDFERLSRLEQERSRRFAALEATREAFKDVPDDELEREVSRALAQVRAERRQHAARER